jgi:O-acetylhomoserine (thiol)-lyase
MGDKKNYGFTTTILHGDRQKGIEHGSLHKPIHTSVAFGYADAPAGVGLPGQRAGLPLRPPGQPDHLGAGREGQQDGAGRRYDLLRHRHGRHRRRGQALLRAGDHVVSSSFLFGNTNSLWQTAMSQGISVSFVDATEVANVEAAITENTRVVFVETIANPRTQVADLKRIGELCKARASCTWWTTP